jgi:hypothetical protein
MNRNNALNNQRGTTVMEAVVVSGIIASLSIIFAAIFIEHVRLVKVAGAVAEIQDQRSVLAARMESMVRSASGIIGSAEVLNVQRTSGPQTLILSLPSVDHNGIVIAQTYDTAVFYLDQNNSSMLLLDIEPDIESARPARQGQPVSHGVERLAFSYEHSQPEEAGSLFVNIRFSQNVYGKSRKLSYARYLVLKNYETSP